MKRLNKKALEAAALELLLFQGYVPARPGVKMNLEPVKKIIKAYLDAAED